MARADTQFNLRIPVELKEQIEVSAKNSGRSINAEATSRLQDSYLMDNGSVLESIKALETLLLLRNSQSTRRTVISERLQELLEDVNQIKAGRTLQPAHIAKEIGEDYAEVVENWFSGQQEPSFKKLEAIAKCFGAAVEWLQFGDGHKFQARYSRIPESPSEGVTWLLDLDRQKKPTSIYFIREQSQEGKLIIVKRYGAWVCETFTTPYHVSEVVGSGGESSLAHLLIIWRLLYKIYTKCDLAAKDAVFKDLMIESYLLPPNEFDSLIKGDIHPLKILRHALKEPWWEDIWDSGQYPKANYWQGWKDLCERMYLVVEQREILKKQKQEINEGTYPFFNQFNRS